MSKLTALGNWLRSLRWVSFSRSSGTTVALPESDTQPIYPYDPNLTERVKTLWMFGQFSDLVALTEVEVLGHPQRALIAAYIGAAHSYCHGDSEPSRQWLEKAKDWGCNSTRLVELMLSSTHASLAEMQMALGRKQTAEAHIDAALRLSSPGSPVDLLIPQRLERLNADKTSDDKENLRLQKFGKEDVVVTSDRFVRAFGAEAVSTLNVSKDVSSSLQEVLRESVVRDLFGSESVKLDEKAGHYVSIDGANQSDAGLLPGVDQRADKPVHMFWVDSTLSRLERLAIASFVANGFNLKLWTYGSISDLPREVELRDAREIIPEDNLFTYKNGSYAGFADLFRYSVLSRYSGIWADMDVISLITSSEFYSSFKEPFLVSERTKDSVVINNNVIFLPKASSGDIIDLARGVATQFRVDKLRWGDCGPRLLTTLVEAYPMIAPRKMDPEFANPFNWWDCPDILFRSNMKLPDTCKFLHCYNEMWRRAGIDKNTSVPEGSIIDEMYRRYGQWM